MRPHLLLLLFVLVAIAVAHLGCTKSACDGLPWDINDWPSTQV